jgi:cysteine-rich repeat protein
MLKIGRIVCVCLVGLVTAACSAGDGRDRGSETAATGSIQVPLVTTTASGETYRLQAMFHIDSGALERDLDGTSDSNTSVSTDLPVGFYLMSLVEGWSISLVTETGEAQVEALLLTANPVAFEVVSQAESDVVWRFRVGDDVIDFGEGRVNISFEVETRATGAGRCSADFGSCSSDADCVQAPLQGFCITRDDAAATQCVFSTRRDTGVTNSCEGVTYGQCQTDEDCPTGLDCGAFGATWCGADAPGTCSTSIAFQCTTDADCAFDRRNVCQLCGDGVVQRSETDCTDRGCQGEHCDDGNNAPGDGCSSECRFEGECTVFGIPVLTGCATDADCAASPPCTDNPCTCSLP